MIPLNASKTTPVEGGVSYSLVARLCRAAWSLCWLLLAAWTPTPLHRWRVLLLNVAGSKIHPTAHVYSSARIWYPPYLRMDAHACMGPRVICYNMAPIHLGEKSIVSQGAHLCAGSHDIGDPNHQLITSPIMIREGAWVAAEAFIGPGLTIGENAVIGARTVLFKNADPNGVYIGNPAKFIKYRKLADYKENNVGSPPHCVETPLP